MVDRVKNILFYIFYVKNVAKGERKNKKYNIVYFGLSSCF